MKAGTDRALDLLTDAIVAMQDEEIAPRDAHTAIMDTAAASALSFHHGDADMARRDFERAMVKALRVSA